VKTEYDAPVEDRTRLGPRTTRCTRVSVPRQAKENAMIILRRSTWIVLLLCVLVGVSLVSAVCASDALGEDETAGPTNGKVVVKIGWMGQIDSLNPFIGWTMEAYEVYSNQYLLFVGRDWETLEPDDLGIVKSWDVSDDGLVWTFTMNEGMS
jgi:ABC-type transport system substrate-binding protein